MSRLKEKLNHLQVYVCTGGSFGEEGQNSEGELDEFHKKGTGQRQTEEEIIHFGKLAFLFSISLFFCGAKTA